MSAENIITRLTNLHDKVIKYKSEAFIENIPEDTPELWSEFELIRQKLLQENAALFKEVNAVKIPASPVDLEGKYIFSPSDFTPLETETRKAIIFGSFMKLK